jgi:hypothetical protein
MVKALAEFKFCCLGINIFMEPIDYDEILLCKILYYARRTGLLAE